MGTPEIGDPTAVVQTINEHRGCPDVIPKISIAGETAVANLNPDERKQEYYFLLDGVLEEVAGVTGELRSQFPGGVVERTPSGKVVSALPRLEERCETAVQQGDFLEATYWTHDAIHKTISIATEEWLKRADTESAAYRRIHALVDNERQQTFGDVAVQKRVASAANQTVLISCSFQRLTEETFAEANGRPITTEEMVRAHGENIRLAMPLTRLHLLETRFIRKELGAESLPDGEVEMYTNRAYFMFARGALQFNGMALAEKMASDYPGEFDDGRVGCPGAKYIPEIWAWTGDLSSQYAFSALHPSQYTFAFPLSLRRTTGDAQ